jgi:TatD DNase family protein
MFTDSHCHLNFPELRSQLPQIREAMAAAQVSRALCICTTMEEFADVHALATTYSNFWSTVGVHPDNEGIYEPTLDDLVQRAKLPKVVAIGETGLDYYQMQERKGGRTVADMEWQRERFRTHIRASRATGLPLVIHTRSASDDTLAILREEMAHAVPAATATLASGQGAALGVASGADSGLKLSSPAGFSMASNSPVTGVFHCFTESMAVARAALDMGFYISFSGILTFKAASDLREVAAYVPLDRCLIETDSPYLAPMPHRGKTNNPSYVPFVAQQLANIKGLGVESIAAATSANFDQLFSHALHA